MVEIGDRMQSLHYAVNVKCAEAAGLCPPGSDWGQTWV
jgi:hypothetical protein